ncbi:MAG: hypothetical protein ACI4PW_05055 [Alphaproteobacteria bacterium]|jgi:hypothetical protein
MFTASDAEKIVAEKYGVKPFSAISDENRKNIINAVSQIIETAEAEGKCPADLTYESLIKSSESMFRFLEICRKYPSLYAPFAVDAAGRPVTDASTPLRCGISLAQAEQFLVTMTAQTQFNKFLPEGMDARKFTMMRPYFTGQWQLPFLTLYENLRDEVILELGPDLLEIKTKSGLESLLRLKLDEITQARQLLREKFTDILRINPLGVRNLLHCSQEQFAALEGVLGDQVYYFLCRESELFDEVLKTPPEILSLFGSALATVSTHSFRRLNRLPPSRSIYFMTRLVDMYPRITKRFADADFVNFTFKNAVDSLIALEGDAAFFEEIVRLKLKAMEEVLEAS